MVFYFRDWGDMTITCYPYFSRSNQCTVCMDFCSNMNASTVQRQLSGPHLSGTSSIQTSSREKNCPSTLVPILIR